MEYCMSALDSGGCVMNTTASLWLSSPSTEELHDVVVRLQEKVQTDLRLDECAFQFSVSHPRLRHLVL